MIQGNFISYFKRRYEYNSRGFSIAGKCKLHYYNKCYEDREYYTNSDNYGNNPISRLHKFDLVYIRLYIIQ